MTQPLHIRLARYLPGRRGKNASMTPGQLQGTQSQNKLTPRIFAKKVIRRILGMIFGRKARVNISAVSEMVDAFMSAGFNYFDTAHTYLGGESERAIRECLVKRYPRDSYILANKLSYNFITQEKDIMPLFESQLKICGVEYFDFYMIHGVSAERYEIFRKCRAFENIIGLKRAGKVRHIGMSFHDSPELLEKILALYPELEFVQIQLNYADIDSPVIQAGKVYDVCEKYNKPVIVMEPVKGGVLVNLPDEAKKILDGLHGGSYASYAIRYAKSFPNVVLVLSGMSNLEMVRDNTAFMKDFQPLSENEREAVDKVREIIRKQNAIQCTSCRYCVEGCPKDIPIPEILACINRRIQYSSGEGNFLSGFYYGVHTKNHGRASDCIKCGKCERECPQHLPIRDLLSKAAGMFE